jgi:hypothetical protein
MRSDSHRKHIRIVIGILTMTVLTGCGFVGGSRLFPSFQGDGFDSNGERIYFTGTNERGERIRYSGGPPFGGMMMTSSLSCASCHGSDGRGGVHTMHMQVMDAPDIRWSTISSGEHGDHGEETEEEEGETAYDRDSFFRVIRDGIEPSGHALSRDMPRWNMRDEDLEDLLHYLESMP